MYAVAIALKHAVTVTYGFYSITLIEKAYFYVSWVFWFVVITSFFASFQMMLFGYVALERKEFLSKKFYKHSTLKLLKNDTR